MSHWIVLPVVLPLLSAVVLLLLARRELIVQRGVSVAAMLALLAISVMLVARAATGGYEIYALGNWQPPFGIILVLDRLSGIMVLLTSVVAMFSLLHAVNGDDAEGAHYHPLFQLQLAGLNGAFLTGDLFNLFVFFEILLIASYCLLVHGATTPRLRSGVHYVLLNLAGSALFLVAIGTLYGVTGTLNMADLSVRVAALGAADAALIRAAGLLLLVVFGLKAAIAPLYFWLPNAYASASAPVAALFAIMTKVGVYAILRVSTLIFGPGAGVAAAVIEPWLLPLALVTIALGMLGALGSGELRRMLAYLLIASVGIMLAAIGLFTRGGVAAGIYYLVHSTLASAAMFLLADLVARQRGDRDDLLIMGPPLLQPALLGPLFFMGAIALSGLPPLSGFVGKVLILTVTPLDAAGFWLWGVLLSGSLLAIIALSRAGSLLFWRPADAELVNEARPAGPPQSRVTTGLSLPTIGLLAAVLGLTLLAGPAADFTAATAEQLLDPACYVGAVLGATEP